MCCAQGCVCELLITRLRGGRVEDQHDSILRCTLRCAALCRVAAQWERDVRPCLSRPVRVARQVHLALLRGAEGRGLGAEGAPPPSAFQLVAAAPGGGGGGSAAAAAARKEAAATAWMQRTSRAVLGAPLDVVGADARVRR